ncbi:hypothetical protein BHE74_00031872 [Ensete ventricosum]|nr:hypothetical protein BHE74_00031872 [Ensete ventricosum]RZS22033.1 hypothetical protein BHM03_00054755 [Ensete ventricosum]
MFSRLLTTLLTNVLFVYMRKNDPQIVYGRKSAKSFFPLALIFFIPRWREHSFLKCMGRASRRLKFKGSLRGSSSSRSRVAFRTKSELEVLDDGYKWRKYGKKKMKNSPNPR